MDLIKVFMLFGVGAIAGFMNVMAGGGSSISLPVLILMGLDGATANGTNRIALMLESLSAVLSFRQRQLQHYQRSLQLSLMTLPGAILGALAAVNISDAWFQRILSLVLIGVVISLCFPTKKNKRNTWAEGQTTWVIYPVMFGIGFYGGFIQVGVGFMLMAALYHILKLDLVSVNMHKVFIVFIYMIPTLGIFLLTDNVHWGVGLCLAAGNAFGGWWGAHWAVKGGEKIIRYVLAAAILIMAMKLLGIF